MRHLSLLLLTCALNASAALTVSVNSFNDACGTGTGWAYAIANGGVAPYTYVWSPAPPVGQGTNMATGLMAGTYTITVTDMNGDVVSASGTVQTIGTLLPGNLTAGAATSCDGACNGVGHIGFFAPAWGGLAPYTTDVQPAGDASVSSSYVSVYGLCPGTTYTCTVTDANGCTSTFSNIEVTDLATPVLLDVQVTPSCAGGETGTAVLTYDQVGQVGYMDQWTGMFVPYQMNGNQAFLNDLAPGDHGVIAYPFDPAGMGGGPMMMGSCGLNTVVSIPVSTDPCGQVSGTVYVDLNGDCVQDASDVPYPWRTVTNAPGGHYELTDGNGQYSEELPYGAFSLDVADPADHAPLCPAALPAPFTLDAVTPNVTLDVALDPLYGADMEALLLSSWARPGFPLNYDLRTLNNGAFPFSAYTATLTYDPTLSYISSSLVPTVNTPGLLEFAVPSLASFGQNNINVVLQVPANPALIGTYLDATLTLTPAPADADPANDTYALSSLVVGAYDPNDKQVLTSSRASNTLYFLDGDSALDYTIRFQNTGNAEALHVRLVDTLAHTLDISTLRLRGATHTFEAELKSDSILIIDFPDIMLPDSTSDLAGSQGSFSFSIALKANTSAGTIIANKADIYFDFNPPIRTNTATLVAEFSTGIVSNKSHADLSVSPNPAKDVLRITLNEGGSGRWVLTDAKGSIVANGNWNGSSMILPVDALRSGLYNITVNTVHGASVARFVKE